MALRNLVRHHYTQLPGKGTSSPVEPIPEVAEAVQENIRTIAALRSEIESRKTLQDRVADRVTRWTGSMTFVYAHAVWFGVWMGLNTGRPPILSFDPYPFGLLTMIVSLEAIFLSTFVMISQNKLSEASERRADLDLQINLLAEYEVTRLLSLVAAMAEKMGIDGVNDAELEALTTVTRPVDIVTRMEQVERAADPARV